MTDELVKMSPKGQLVVPMEIREKEKFRPSDRFVAFDVKGGVLFKKVDIPDVRGEFKALSEEIAKKFKETEVKESDIEGAVKWARQRRH
ncbi:MAG: hypothetical protein HZB66_03165 [Candidatus Aenigmarchaeota archaeon]|nr:hypothetical protein [Candidatus Aenigmarchaeota archaeon]